MGFFSPKPLEDDTSRRYLSVAPPGVRIEVLAAACVQQVRELPVAGSDQFGQLLTLESLSGPSELVRNILFQDRDLTGFIVRKVMQHLYVIVSDYMDGENYGKNLETFFDAAGISIAGHDVLISDLSQTIAESDAKMVKALAVTVLSVIRAQVLGPSGTSEEEYRLFVQFHTEPPDSEINNLAYDVIAWEAVTMSRLLNTGLIRDGLPILQSNYRNVPVMNEAGWYPNPNKIGGIVDGDAAIQRYWDGEQWTDRVRIRENRTWKSLTVSIHSAPSD